MEKEPVKHELPIAPEIDTPALVTVLSMGYNDIDRNTGNRDRYGFAAKGKMVSRTLIDTLNPEVQINLWDDDATPSNIINTLSTLNASASPRDTLVIYYTGHGNPMAMELPDSQNPSSGKLEDLSKENFFLTLDKFPGRKMIILSCCFGDYEQLPENTLLITPSAGDTEAYTDSFETELVGDLMRLQNTEDPITSFTNILLTKYNNRPYGPLDDKVWIVNRREDLRIYEEEKNTGKEILKGRERSKVRSTLIQDGIPLIVDPRTEFIK